MVQKMLRNVIIAMGSVCDTIDETIDYLLAQGEKVGVVKVRLYRPFCAQALVRCYSGFCKIASMFLTEQKSQDALGEPLYLDVVAALKDTKFDAVTDLHRTLRTWFQRYNTGSDRCCITRTTAKAKFTIGIVDDVTEPFSGS